MITGFREIEDWVQIDIRVQDELWFKMEDWVQIDNRFKKKILVLGR